MVTQTPDGAVEFQFYRPKAQHMSLAGEFNGWQKCFYMTKNADGWWKCRLRLAPGMYEFKYYSNGQWFTDYAAFGVVPYSHGWNSVVKVDPPTIKMPTRESVIKLTPVQAA